MRKTLLAGVRARGGVITRSEARALVSDHILDEAVAAGVVVRLFPETFVLAERATDVQTRRRAALAYRPDGALSHLDALEMWEVIQSEHTDSPGDIYLTVSGERSNVEVAGIRLCRRQGFVAGAPLTVVRRELTVVRLEQAIVESWPLLSPLERRAPAIVAVRERLTTAGRLQATLARQPRTAGARQMRELFDLLAQGIHSELEAWGHQHVFSDRRLPTSRPQVKATLPNGRTVYLDRLYEAEMVNVELDGAAYHGRPGQRERDLRRDAALASMGYVTVRFSHPRLFHESAECVEELLATLATRRRQLGLQPA